MENKRFKTIITVILFTILFVAVGWVAPAFYALYAPQDNYIQVHSFETTNATIGQDVHTVCFERTIKERSVGKVFTEVYLLSDDGKRVKVSSQNKERVFQEGRATVRIRVHLPDDIEAGEYRYERVYNMKLANGRVTRQFSFESEPFMLRPANTSVERANC